MAVVLVLVQTGVLVRDHILVVHAAREAARAAAVTPTTEAARSAAVAATDLNPRRLVVDTSGNRTTGGRLRVIVSYRTQPSVPVVGKLFPKLTIQEQLTIRVE